MKDVCLDDGTSYCRYGMLSRRKTRKPSTCIALSTAFPPNKTAVRAQTNFEILRPGMSDSKQKTLRHECALPEPQQTAASFLYRHSASTTLRTQACHRLKPHAPRPSRVTSSNSSLATLTSAGPEIRLRPRCPGRNQSTQRLKVT